MKQKIKPIHHNIYEEDGWINEGIKTIGKNTKESKEQKQREKEKKLSYFHQSIHFGT